MEAEPKATTRLPWIATSSPTVAATRAAVPTEARPQATRSRSSPATTPARSSDPSMASGQGIAIRSWNSNMR